MVGPSIGISFSLRRGRVLIYRDTIRALGYPDYFRFLINKNACKIAMEVCKFGDDGFQIVPDFNTEVGNNSYEISSLKLLQLVWSMCGWDLNGSYRVFGTIYEKQGVVDFDLSKAEKIFDSEYKDPEAV